jgi:hypothetical protein
LDPNLRWQYENNLNSLVNSEQRWKDHYAMESYWHLLSRQRHNGGVLALYRACWRANAAAVMKMISDLLEH